MSLGIVEPQFGSASRSYVPPFVCSKRAMRRELIRAKLILGRRMYALGIDDGAIGAWIAELDRTIKQTAADAVMSQSLRSERNRLLIQLAEAALEFDAPMPGANKEYREARMAEAKLRSFDYLNAEMRTPVGFGTPSAL